MNFKQRALPNREIFPPAAVNWRGTEASRAPVVLIVDEDLGFVWWLGQIFSQAGCQVVPALDPRQTASITRDLNLKVDVIVANPDLVSISEVMQGLDSGRPPKVVAIRNTDAGFPSVTHAHSTMERPSGWGPVSQKEWQGCVSRVVRDVHASRIELQECS